MRTDELRCDVVVEQKDGGMVRLVGLCRGDDLTPAQPRNFASRECVTYPNHLQGQPIFEVSTQL
jgi:hypothetical protein